ncbi:MULTISPECIES: GNAT family N-acetyltransferase [Nocardiopsis]|uniref:GCN5 family acetyltransferase n=1 Tax=Nocardiopsis sinuspersici TaxID=501010 RepID=A0A1V3C2L9_9ACTN|nr:MULTISPECIES: GNAT family N-acetyltransferase [Nocardiopsis]OOC54630.1 GCN5 family acetyltransferase [Nocardiopsis sinuspersici]
MAIEILPMGRADVPRVLPLLRAVHPCRVLTEDAVRWRVDNPSPGSRETSLLAVEDGAVVGFLRSVLRCGGEGPCGGRSFLASVAASHRGTDVGAHLLEASERDLLEGGAEVLRAEAADEAVQAGGDEFRRTLLDHGYALEGTHHILGLDLSALPEAPPAPEGVELRPFTDYADDPREVYWIDRLTTLDEPGADPWFPSYEDWRTNVWGHPLTDLDLCLLVLADGVPAALTCYASDGGTRLESSMTGTLRRHRGRGLAGYAKAVALHRARERGLTHAYTGNHEDNAPMLAVNERLGYTLVGTETGYVKRLRA